MCKTGFHAICLALTFSCCVSLVSRAQNTSFPENETIRGTVINSVTHKPVGRALVSSPDQRFATLTDSEGYFEFTMPPAAANGGSLSPGAPPVLSARKPGFLGNQGRDIQMYAQVVAGKPISISLTPEAVIAGHVSLPSSDIFDRLRVELYRREVREGRAHWPSAGTTMTRSNGEFRFSDLQAGDYKLLTRELLDRDPVTFDPRGQLYGYPPVYFSGARDFTSAETISLSAGQTLAPNITLVKHPYYQIKLPVMKLGEGRGLNVFVYAQGRGPGYSLGYDNRDGTISGTLPDGNYTVEAVSYSPTSAGFVNIAVKGAAVEGIPVVMAPGGTISVNVKEEFTSSEDAKSTQVTINTGRGIQFDSHGPRRYLRVYLEPADEFGPQQGGLPRDPRDANDESIVIESVIAGRYWVKASSTRGFVASLTCGGVDLFEHPLLIGAGGSSAPIEVTMRDDGAEVDGTVETSADLTSTSQPAGHVYFVAEPDGGGDFREAWISPDGKFSLQQVPPGLYRVLAFEGPRQDLEFRNPDVIRRYASKGQSVRLVAGQKEHLKLQLITPGE